MGTMTEPLKKRPNSQKFWDTEYKKSDYLKLSTEESEDLVKFTRFLEREFGRKYLHPIASVLDMGCGNGRNLVYLARTFGVRGVGYDISSQAIAHARASSDGLPLTYGVLSSAELIPLADKSQTIVLDMMAMHFLSLAERTQLIQEITRVLKPGGWFFLKTFLLDEDTHAARLLRDNPADEPGTYMHPSIGVPEHVFTEDEIIEMLGEEFYIHKITKSHRHKSAGAKRRSISVYAQKLG